MALSQHEAIVTAWHNCYMLIQTVHTDHRQAAEAKDVAKPTHAFICCWAAARGSGGAGLLRSIPPCMPGGGGGIPGDIPARGMAVQQRDQTWQLHYVGRAQRAVRHKATSIDEGCHCGRPLCYIVHPWRGMSLRQTTMLHHPSMVLKVLDRLRSPNILHYITTPWEGKGHWPDSVWDH